MRLDRLRAALEATPERTWCTGDCRLRERLAIYLLAALEVSRPRS